TRFPTEQLERVNHTWVRFALTQFPEWVRGRALERLLLLRPHLEEGVALTRLAQEHGVALRTAQRWVERYRRHGLVGLASKSRSDRGGHRLPVELQQLIEGLGTSPGPSQCRVGVPPGPDGG